MLELPLPSVASLEEVNLEISDSAVRISSIDTSEEIASADVPGAGDSNQAGAKWSKKRRVLTVRMPRR